MPTRWGPPVIRWFINPINYSYRYHKLTIVIGVINQLSYLGGPTLYGKSPCLMGKSPCLMGKSSISTGPCSSSNCKRLPEGRSYYINNSWKNILLYNLYYSISLYIVIYIHIYKIHRCPSLYLFINTYPSLYLFHEISIIIIYILYPSMSTTIILHFCLGLMFFCPSKNHGRKKVSKKMG